MYIPTSSSVVIDLRRVPTVRRDDPIVAIIASTSSHTGPLTLRNDEFVKALAKYDALARELLPDFLARARVQRRPRPTTSRESSHMNVFAHGPARYVTARRLGSQT